VEWDGDGAVRVHAVEKFDDTTALLLERCLPGTSLAHQPEPEQDTVIAALLPRLWTDPVPGHRFRSLQRCAISGRTSSTTRGSSVVRISIPAWP
jgi:streptomycin 6-kinase